MEHTEGKRQVGRPKKEEQTVQFSLVLPPAVIKSVKLFKAQTGKTISEITAKALNVCTSVTNFFANTMDRFLVDESAGSDQNALRRVEWAKKELERFQGVERGIYEYIDILKRDKSEFEKLSWEEAREWHMNDIDEQINRAHEDIQLNERRMSYYRNIIKMEGRI